MAGFEALDGATVNDGDTVTLTLSKGTDEPMVATGSNVELPHGDYSEREVTGTVRSYEHVDRVLDDEGYAVDKIVTLVWEISADDATIGFLPERVLTANKT